MEKVCRGISDDECFKLAIEEYEAQQMDNRAIRQAQRKPLSQALLVLKWMHGYSGPRIRPSRTMSHNKELCKRWNNIMAETKRHFGCQTNEDINPELLGEMNLYAINLIMESELS